MLYYEIKDNIIVGIYSGDMPKQKHSDTKYLVVERIYANIGDDIGMYSDIQTGTKKPLTQLVEEGLVPVTVKPDEKVEGDYIVKKTKKELYDEGMLSKEEYNLYIDELRQAAYQQEADPLGMQVLRGELDKTEWLAKIDEIKRRYPKVG